MNNGPTPTRRAERIAERSWQEQRTTLADLQAYWGDAAPAADIKPPSAFRDHTRALML